jgi:hypothetical protein
MPKSDGTWTFEDWLQDLVEHTQFDEGDSTEKFLKLGKDFLEEELRKEGDKLRRQRLRRNLAKKDNNPGGRKT